MNPAAAAQSQYCIVPISIHSAAVNQHPLTTYLALLWLLCACTAASTASATTYDLPTLGAPASTALSPARAQRLGQRVVAQLLQAGRIVEDVELRQYLRQVGTRLLAPTSHDADAFRFFMVANPAINAFALPGGYIGINAGLITETDNESELASVMAHEIAHITQRHIARQIQATQGMQWATLAAVLAAAIAGSGDGDAIQAAITGSISAMRQRRISFTRAHELEADRIGIRMLAAAHFDPDAMAAFFETMQRHARLYGRHLPQILLTHPVNNTRIAEARARAQDYPDPTVMESADYAVMKERTRVLTQPRRSQLLDYYRSQGAPEKTPAAKDYGYALTLARVGRADDAVAILQRLARTHPDQSYYATALARAQATAGHTQAALATLKNARQRFPDAPAITLEYAATLMDSGQPRAARAFLLRQPELTRHNYHAQKLLARIAGRNNNRGEAYYHQALYHRLRGAYVPAIRRLRSALHEADLSSIDQHRLDALLGQIIAQCKAAWPNGACRQQVLRQNRR